jgi:hypothetical protein
MVVFMRKGDTSSMVYERIQKLCMRTLFEVVGFEGERKKSH